ncbi:MAG: hypothetical protein GVY02_00275 [Bacteroidetes bacterium]|jgi:hypothetical protein|nr:hypothetical protein [Bacteroidota bacterium]
MAGSDRKNKIKVIGIIAILVVSFLSIYYVSTESYQKRFQEARQERVEAINKTEYQAKKRRGDRIVLKRGERHEVGRTSIVFKGLQDSDILVDLYLHDLDPKQRYLKKVPTDEAEDGFELGGVKYSLVTVNDRYLTLKLLRLSRTP